MTYPDENHYQGLPASAAFFHTRRPLRDVEPIEVVRNRLTRMKTVNLSTYGSIQLEPLATAGEIHQFTVMQAGCSTGITILDGDRIIFCMPVLQTGSFRLEAAFHNGLIFSICTASDAPPHITVNWRAKCRVKP